MKKFTCALFIFVIVLSCFLFSNKSIDEIFKRESIVSIKAIMDGNIDIKNCVFNGNKTIICVENLSELNKINYCGVTLIIDKTRFQKTRFIDRNNLELVNKYCVGDNKVYDFKLLNYKILGSSSIQIVVKEDYLVIGIPMILNDF